VLNYAWLTAAPAQLPQPVSLVITVGFTLMAIMTFIWLLMGVHQILLAEKGRLQQDLTRFLR
jgi:hypothetical protein